MRSRTFSSWSNTSTSGLVTVLPGGATQWSLAIPKGNQCLKTLTVGGKAELSGRVRTSDHTLTSSSVLVELTDAGL